MSANASELHVQHNGNSVRLPAAPLPLTALVDGQAVELHAFDEHDAEQCSACDGRGYEVDCCEDGPCVGDRCKACAGTGEHKFCSACLETLSARDEAPDSMLATVEVIAHNGYMRPSRRLACQSVECLKHAMESAARSAKSLRLTFERAAKDHDAQVAAIEANVAAAERSGLLDEPKGGAL